MNTPKGWFRCRNLAGKESLAFSCAKCRLTILRGITERGVWHCGAFEKPPLILPLLPLFKIPALHTGLIGDFGAVKGALVNWD